MDFLHGYATFVMSEISKFETCLDVPITLTAVPSFQQAFFCLHKTSEAPNFNPQDPYVMHQITLETPQVMVKSSFETQKYKKYNKFNKR